MVFCKVWTGWVEMEECSIGLTPDGPHRESLLGVVERVYAMLSND